MPETHTAPTLVHVTVVCDLSVNSYSPSHYRRITMDEVERKPGEVATGFLAQDGDAWNNRHIRSGTFSDWQAAIDYMAETLPKTGVLYCVTDLPSGNETFHFKNPGPSKRWIKTAADDARHVEVLWDGLVVAMREARAKKAEAKRAGQTVETGVG